jgi:hypothetical protein
MNQALYAHMNNKRKRKKNQREVKTTKKKLKAHGMLKKKRNSFLIW